MTEAWLQAERLEAKRERWLRWRPRCEDCGHPIQDERCFPLDSGGFLCPRCVEGRMVETDKERYF